MIVENNLGPIEVRVISAAADVERARRRLARALNIERWFGPAIPPDWRWLARYGLLLAYQDLTRAGLGAMARAILARHGARR